MFGQAFALYDIPKIFFLAFLEIILSADNAIVLGLFAAHLPVALRPKALYIGLVSSLIIRSMTIFLFIFFIHIRWIQILGAAYLLFLSIQYFIKKKKLKQEPTRRSFWKTIVLIEIFDIIFAIDSILAGIAFISSDNPKHTESKIWIVYVGAMIGLFAIRYASHCFSRIISKFPNMEKSAYLMIAWIAIKLIYELFPHPLILEYYYWGIFIVLFLFGFWKKGQQHVE
ncbi:MAG TPA: hypothetical protein VLE96_07160 [Chlamydiales bacterium]|nr:hypothetical protein [Chlamydiales bacterium]